MILHGAVAIYINRDEKDVNSETQVLKEVQEKLPRGSIFHGVNLIKFSALSPDYESKYPHLLGIRDRKFLVYKPEFLAKELKFISQEEISPQSKIFDQSGVLRFTYIASLREGSIFGEKGLDESTPRTATVLCISDCDFGYLLKKDYDHILKEINRADTERRKTFFNKNVFKDNITAKIALRLSYDFYKTKLEVKRNFSLRKQGEKGTLIYVVKRGQISVEKLETMSKPLDPDFSKIGSLAPSREYQKRFVISILGEGELFGEEVLFGGKESTYSITVSSNEATIMSVTVECMKSYMKIDKKVTEFLKNLHNLREKQWRSILEQMKANHVHPSLTELKDTASKPIASLQVVDRESFMRKYNNDVSKFLIKQVSYRLPYLVRQSDTETCVEIPEERKSELWEQREATTEHYLEQDHLLKEVDRQDWMLKHRYRQIVKKKFNRVLHEQMLENCKMKGVLLLKKKRFNLDSSSENSILNAFNKKIDHHMSELNSFRHKDSSNSSLVCTSQDKPFSTIAANARPRGLEANHHSKSASAIIGNTLYDNCADLSDQVISKTGNSEFLNSAGEGDDLKKSQIPQILIDSSAINNPVESSRVYKEASSKRKTRLLTYYRSVNKLNT